MSIFRRNAVLCAAAAGLFAVLAATGCGSTSHQASPTVTVTVPSVPSPAQSAALQAEARAIAAENRKLAAINAELRAASLRASAANQKVLGGVHALQLDLQQVCAFIRNRFHLSRAAMPRPCAG